MSADALVKRSSDRLAALERWEERRLGDLARAREKVAEALKVAPGTLERIRRRRVKDVRGSVWVAIRDRFAEALTEEIARLQDDLALARADGLGLDSGPSRAAEAALVAAEKALRG